MSLSPLYFASEHLYNGLKYGFNSNDPVIEFGRNAHFASGEMRSRRDPIYIREADIPGEDKEIFSGAEVATHGIKLLAYDHKHKTCRMYVVKALDEGDVRRVGDKVYATPALIKRAYHPFAYYDPSVDPNDVKLSNTIARNFDRNWIDFGQVMADRDQKHFTLYHAKVSDLPDDLCDFVNVNTETEIATNGRFFYVIDRNDQGTYDLRFFVPTYRKKGSFVSAPLKDRWYSFNRVSTYLCKGVSKEECRHKMAVHWGGQSSAKGEIVVLGTSSKLWDELRNFCSDPVSRALYRLGRLRHFPQEKPWNIASAAVAAMFSASVGLKPLEGALIGSAIHLVADEGVDWARNKYRRLRAAFADASSYGGKNCADVTNTGNLFKTCPHADVNEHDPDQIEILDIEQGNPKEGVRRSDRMRPFDVVSFIISMEQRGLSSIAVLPKGDEITMKAYVNGVMYIKVNLKCGGEIFFARFRDDICLNRKLLLPESLRDQLGDGVTYIYKPKNSTSRDCEVLQGLSVEETVLKMEEALRMLGDTLAPEQKAKLLEDVRIRMDKPNYSYLRVQEETNPENIVYMSGKSGEPPDAKAANVQLSVA